MTTDEKWQYIEKTLVKLMLSHDLHYGAVKAAMIEYESPLVEPMWKVQSLLVDALELLIGDEWGNVNWYVTECDFGREPKEAGIEGDMRVIQTVSELRWLIELQCT